MGASSDMGGRKIVNIWEKIIQTLIKLPQQFGSVTPSSFEDTVDTVKICTKVGPGRGFIKGSLI